MATRIELAPFDEERYIVDMYRRGEIGIDPDNPITLKSGRKSPHYHNQRGMLSHDATLVQDGYMSLSDQRAHILNTAAGYGMRFSEISREFQHVFGKAQAATASMAVAAVLSGYSYLWERVPEPQKGYGKKKPIEGHYEPGDLVHLADDNTTDGKSKIEGADILRQEGLEVVGITVGFDREEGAQEVLEGLGYEFNAVTGLSAAVAVLRDNGMIGQREVEAVAAYHEALRADGITSTFQPKV